MPKKNKTKQKNTHSETGKNSSFFFHQFDILSSFLSSYPLAWNTRACNNVHIPWPTLGKALNYRRWNNRQARISPDGKTKTKTKIIFRLKMRGGVVKMERFY